MGVTWGMNEPEPYQGGGGGGMYDIDLGWRNLAEVTYDTLDPFYGEGGMLEPVTVAVDPDRDLYDEYGPQIDTAIYLIGAIAAIAILK